ncbi:MAG: beta-galactosidase [Clostridia bacterium]|nr:beta-galactosidase [Clostridia bacterium]
MIMIPRNEHPNPQFMRKEWICLNGKWDFEIDNARSGKARGYDKPDAVLNAEITVPFCPQSRLSGVEHKDFIYGVWYKKALVLDRAQTEKNVFLHFGAVDYKAYVYINGEKAGEHRGGYVSFTVNISPFVHEGENIITVYAEDNERDPMIPRGKQSEEYYSHGCDYTRTTGIWQSVWVEFAPKTYIEKIRIYPDINKPGVTLQAQLCGKADFTAEAIYDGKSVGKISFPGAFGTVSTEMELTEKHLWETGCGRLYTLKLKFGDDEVESYFGLRQVNIDGYKFLINGKSVFQRLILDQGFYPDGIYTAPTDEELEGDIKRSLACGYNGARLHQKVFEPRFLYHADRLGYLVWGEYPNWGLEHTVPESIYGILPEWLEEVDRDFNHPSVIGWCPFNETWDRNGCKQYDPLLDTVYRATKAADNTRPCIDTSGNYHVSTDIFDVHDYEQNPAVFKENYDKLMTDGTLYDRLGSRQHYKGGITFVSEFGGIRWVMKEDEKAWGYGSAPETVEEFMTRYKGLVDALLDNDRFFGFCYTQLTDIEQEQNGLYTYDRTPKFDLDRIHAITSRKAAIED